MEFLRIFVRRWRDEGLEEERRPLPPPQPPLSGSHSGEQRQCYYTIGSGEGSEFAIDAYAIAAAGDVWSLQPLSYIPLMLNQLAASWSSELATSNGIVGEFGALALASVAAPPVPPPSPRRAAEIQWPEQPQKRTREPLRRGTVSPRLPVPDHIPLPPYTGTNRLPDVDPDRQLHDRESIACMRASCELAARVLEHAGTLVKPSVTTDEIDRAVHQMIIDAGAYPSPLGYGGFPKSVCTSVNECICHGIPDSRVLQNGDIINIDVTVYLNGYHGDTSRTYLCGEVDESTMQLVKVTEECMLRGISACKHGASFKTIGQRISEYVDEYGYGIDPFIGHGVGKIFHSEPIIWHTYDYEPGYMVAGQTFTIGRAYLVHGRHPVHHVGRRVDGCHGGRQPHSAVRAHHLGHRRRRRDPHHAPAGEMTRRDSMQLAPLVYRAGLKASFSQFSSFTKQRQQLQHFQIS
uniref:Methionine aminopeptidase n=1 Tax=Oryza punctata TaxID=4537 RepID=A0A0E0LJV4_ORYPU